jgi:hypothetical protein
LAANTSRTLHTPREIAIANASTVVDAAMLVKLRSNLNPRNAGSYHAMALPAEVQRALPWYLALWSEEKLLLPDQGFTMYSRQGDLTGGSATWPKK